MHKLRQSHSLNHPLSTILFWTILLIMAMIGLYILSTPRETYQDDNYCRWNEYQSICECVSINGPLLQSTDSCVSNCAAMTRDQCLQQSPLSSSGDAADDAVPRRYYCPNLAGEECVAIPIQNVRVADMRCYKDPMTQVSYRPVVDKLDCNLQIDPCRIHHDRDSCIADPSCGFCTQEQHSRCVSGDDNGPYDSSYSCRRSTGTYVN